MRKPSSRHEKPLRLDDLSHASALLAPLLKTTSFQGSPKHKRNPERFGLSCFQGSHGDANLCDEDAGFSPSDSRYVRSWMERGIRAGLVGNHWEQGRPRVLWAVGDNGWIFEGRITNITQGVYHGYPLMPDSPNARIVFDRFYAWVQEHPKPRHKSALENCRNLYGF